MRHDRISTRQSAVDTAVEQLRRWAGGGGTVDPSRDDPGANLSALAQVRYTVPRGEIVHRG